VGGNGQVRQTFSLPSGGVPGGLGTSRKVKKEKKKKKKVERGTESGIQNSLFHLL
jgi:hypothetical protein